MTKTVILKSFFIKLVNLSFIMSECLDDVPIQGLAGRRHKFNTDFFFFAFAFILNLRNHYSLPLFQILITQMSSSFRKWFYFFLVVLGRWKYFALFVILLVLTVKFSFLLEVIFLFIRKSESLLTFSFVFWNVTTLWIIIMENLVLIF